jgi:hypothetical protein
MLYSVYLAIGRSLTLRAFHLPYRATLCHAALEMLWGITRRRPALENIRVSASRRPFARLSSLASPRTVIVSVDSVNQAKSR